MIVGTLPLLLGGILLFLNPSYIGLLFRHPLGLVMLGVGTVMQTAGLLIIRRMVEIDL